MKKTIKKSCVIEVGNCGSDKDFATALQVMINDYEDNNGSCGSFQNISISIEGQKKQDKLAKRIEKMLQKDDEDQLSDIWLRLMEEMESDEECPDRKTRRILRAWQENPELVDDLLITLCGWSLESLLNKAGR